MLNLCSCSVFAHTNKPLRAKDIFIVIRFKNDCCHSGRLLNPSLFFFRSCPLRSHETSFLKPIKSFGSPIMKKKVILKTTEVEGGIEMQKLKVSH